MTAIISLSLLASLPSLGLAIGPPEVASDVDRQLILRAGDTVRLSCPVDSDPLPMFSWFKDDVSIHQGWHRFRVLTRALKIKDVELEDSGIYRCRATNGFGSIDVEYVVFVKPSNAVLVNNVSRTDKLNMRELLDPDGTGQPPEWTHYGQMQEDRHMQRPVGSLVRLRCRASGHPRPAMLWFFGSAVITGEEEHVELDQTLPEDRHSLRMQNVQPLHSGNYMCRAFNHLGRINFTYTLEVVGHSRKPVILDLYPGNATVASPHRASLQCAVLSDRRPDIKWLKRVDDPRSIIHRNTTIKVDGTYFVVLPAQHLWQRDDGSYMSELVIAKTVSQDSGMYVCLGANRRGYNYRSTFLTVLPPANISERFTDYSQITLPVLVAIPGVIIVLIVIIVVCVVKRDSRTPKPPDKYPSHSPAHVPNYDKPPYYSPQTAYSTVQHTPPCSRDTTIPNYYTSDVQSEVSQPVMPLYMSQQMLPLPHNYPAPPLQIYQQQQQMEQHTYGPC